MGTNHKLIQEEALPDLMPVEINGFLSVLGFLVFVSLSFLSLTVAADSDQLQLTWSSNESDNTFSVAWGDFDSDGDLDAAVGNGCYSGEANRLYRNDGGVLSPSAIWSSAEEDRTGSVAWGDYDGDGDLDLAVGNGRCISGRPNRLYRNDYGVLIPTAVWSSAETDRTYSIAWADYDGDSDLDLAVGNLGEPNRLYRNDGGALTDSAVWSSDESDRTYSVAWGDYDGDGDLDLAAGNDTAPIRLYRNDGGMLTTSAVWSSTESSSARSVAWGDHDGDGDLDLAAGGSGAQLYRNDSGILTNIAIWSSAEADLTCGVAWGDFDGDGDLDLATGNADDPNRLYRNDGGVLVNSAVWSSAETDRTMSIAWGDYDGDGDLDLMTGSDQGPNRVYRNEGVALLTSAAWSSAESDVTRDGIAWGDYDGDGDLDLAVGNDAQPNRLYRNDSGTLTTNAVWSSIETDQTDDVAWGDYDGDGDLDLAVGNRNQPNRLYQNEDGTLMDSAGWSSLETDSSQSVAWGDYDGDGDLDLAIGNWGDPNRLYRNDDGVLTSTAVWSFASSSLTYSVAWGDYDGDGDLDLAVGNYGTNLLYRNDGGVLTAEAEWSSHEMDSTHSVAWGDYDNDGDLDLAVGNTAEPNRLYQNEGGSLTPIAVWSSVEADETYAIAWGDCDGDGDLDLAVGNNGWPAGQPNRLYRNDRGTLTASAMWSSTETDRTESIAWGDYDGDGDLDLVVGNFNDPNRVYRSVRADLILSSAQDLPIIRVERPIPPANADFYSSQFIWANRSVPITYTLFEENSIPARKIVGWYSLNGGGQWLSAVAMTDTVTTNLTTSPYPTRTVTNTHVYEWDLFESGLMGQSDSVVFRLVAVPTIMNTANQVPGPYLFGSYASSTFPFRVRSSQIRVMSSTVPVSEAMVYRQPASHANLYEPYQDKTGRPFRTNPAGYLGGRGEIGLGDRLVALSPVTYTESYTLYHTSATPAPTGLDAYTVTALGVQTLTVSADHPLVLFNIDVSLEWDARQDADFLFQLESNLQRASEFLYDWTDGQAALGKVTVYHDRERWNEAMIRVYASNQLRPGAAKGGIATDVFTDPLTSTVTYAPGQVRMGATWTRYGDPGGSLGEDWPRTLAHELAHFALFLDDNYLGLDEQGFLRSVDTCPGAMSDPYRDDDSLGFGEFHPAAGWLPECEETLSQRSVGRSDWETITALYPWLDGELDNPGPSLLPLAVTEIQFVEPITPPTTLEAPIFSLFQGGARVVPGGSARACLFQGERLVDLGRPTLDQVLARGARPGERLCVFEPDAGRLGCERIEPPDYQLELFEAVDWQPEVAVTPVTSRTLVLTVTDVPEGLPLAARLYPVNYTAPPTVTLVGAGTAYTATFELAEPVFEGYIHLWVDEGASRREAVTDYALGGNPGRMWARFAPRGSPGRMWARFAPVMSADGQMMLYGENLDFEEGEFYALQAMAGLPDVPSWVTVVGRGYRLAATANAPDLSGASVAFGYLGSEVPPGEEDWLRVYYWDGTEWQPLATQLDTYHNMASAPAQGPGLYALMSSIELSLYGPGWNLIAYPIQETRPVTVALLSISGYYTTVYGYEASDPDPLNRWRVYDVTVPPWVNDLEVLEFGLGYWINVSQDIMLRLKGAATTRQMVDAGIESPPATYYGEVRPGTGFVPAAGMEVRAWVGNHWCGQAQTMEVDGQVVYAINVLADGPGYAAGCGQEGQGVRFDVQGHLMAPVVEWSSSQLWEVPLTPIQRVYLPLTVRH